MDLRSEIVRFPGSDIAGLDRRADYRSTMDLRLTRKFEVCIRHESFREIGRVLKAVLFRLTSHLRIPVFCG